MGANAPVVNPIVCPKDWPVKDDEFELVALEEPITNAKILPHTGHISGAARDNVMLVVAARDSFENSSFVIRSGNKELHNVTVTISDLVTSGEPGITNRNAMLHKYNIDIRIVKCWFQAGTAINDTKHKILTPELLLHDDSLVMVDYAHQVNIVKNIDKIQDTKVIQPFIVPAKQNKQVWLTINVPKDQRPGIYKGLVTVAANGNTKTIPLLIEILPFVLPEPTLEYAFYYEGRLTSTGQPKVSYSDKTPQQMLADLIDMRNHGLTNATVWHQFSTDTSMWSKDQERLRQTLSIRKMMGWGSEPLLYLDWTTTFKNDLALYRRKLRLIKEVAQEYGINKIYIYGVDEVTGHRLKMLRPLYQAVREEGLMNFVACKEDFLLYVPDLLDLPNLARKQEPYVMNIIKKIGVLAWNYGNPQNGVEEPATYRNNYGLSLILNGFHGTCNYAYQGSWNDFKNHVYRSHAMAYATLDEPIPTMQWEGWRAGVNDVRYLTLLRGLNPKIDDYLNSYHPPPVEFRNSAIAFLKYSKPPNFNKTSHY